MDSPAIFSQLVNSYSPVAPPAIDQMFSSGTLEDFEKNDIVFAQKRFNGYEYFQLAGISHRFNTDSDDQVITTGIYSGPQVITPHFARTRNSQGIFSLQALSNCRILKIPIGLFDEFRFHNDQIRAFGQRVVEKEFIRHLQYEVLFRSQTAKERLLYFRSEYPLAENLIPHNIIASFLGITPVSFSRLRNSLAKTR